MDFPSFIVRNIMDAIRTEIMVELVHICSRVYVCFSHWELETIYINRFSGYYCSCSTQLSMNFNLLINVKMPTMVDILLFISRINTTYECFIIFLVFYFL